VEQQAEARKAQAMILVHVQVPQVEQQAVARKAQAMILVHVQVPQVGLLALRQPTLRHGEQVEALAVSIRWREVTI